MQEFIEELKYNQNINLEKGIENRIDIGYVIERLEDIKNNLIENIALIIRDSEENKEYPINKNDLLTIEKIIEDKGVFK